MEEQNILKAFKVLKKNNLNPCEFFVNEDETLADAYYKTLNKKKEKKEEPKAKYTIYCHKKRQKGIMYVEDFFAQSEYSNMTAAQIDELFKNNDNKLYCCYDCFLNRLGCLMAEGDAYHMDYEVVFYQDNNAMHTRFSRDGYITNWPMGYFSYID